VICRSHSLREKCCCPSAPLGRDPLKPTRCFDQVTTEQRRARPVWGLLAGNSKGGGSGRCPPGWGCPDRRDGGQTYGAWPRSRSDTSITFARREGLPPFDPLGVGAPSQTRPLFRPKRRVVWRVSRQRGRGAWPALAQRHVDFAFAPPASVRPELEGGAARR
jgi:hypothetical protein